MSSDSRTMLCAPSREFHDPRKLPYEAIRRAWWNGVWACFLWVIVIGGVTMIVVLIILDRNDGSAKPAASYGRLTTGPTSASASSPASVASAERLPGAMPPPMADRNSPTDRGRGQHSPAHAPAETRRLNPAFPQTLPPNDSLR